MKESRKQFIKEAHNHACSDWKQKIENEFPKLFKSTELEFGKWYKSDGGHLFCFNGKYSRNSDSGAYGFTVSGYWEKNIGVCLDGANKYIPATDKEVEQALIKESEKRWFKEGVSYKCLVTKEYHKIKGKLSFKYEDGGLYTYINNCLHHKCFGGGEWSEVKENTLTKAEAEEKLNCKIID